MLALSLPLFASKTEMGVIFASSSVFRFIGSSMLLIKISLGCIFEVWGVFLRFLNTSWFADLSNSLCQYCCVLRVLMWAWTCCWMISVELADCLLFMVLIISFWAAIWVLRSLMSFRAFCRVRFLAVRSSVDFVRSSIVFFQLGYPIGLV